MESDIGERWFGGMKKSETKPKFWRSNIWGSYWSLPLTQLRSCPTLHFCLLSPPTIFHPQFPQLQISAFMSINHNISSISLLPLLFFLQSCPELSNFQVIFSHFLSLSPLLFLLLHPSFPFLSVLEFIDLPELLPSQISIKGTQIGCLFVCLFVLYWFSNGFRFTSVSMGKRHYETSDKGDFSL